MIYEHFGLETDPFSLRPDLDFLFLSRSHEEAIAHLVYGLEQQEDITLIVGDIGTGKTLAIHRLLTGISDSFVPVSVTVTTLGFAQVLGLILRKLDVGDIDGLPLDALLHRFEKRLEEIRGEGRKVLLVIDEAQNLDPDCLESVRLLMNLAQPGSQVLQMVLAGQLGLADNLALPQLKQFRQRIRVQYNLATLDRAEVEAYIVHRLKTAGREKPLFRKGALDIIHGGSGGVPRLVNHLASKAMLGAFVAKSDAVGPEHVDLDDLPGDDAAPAPTPVATPVPPVATAEPPRVESATAADRSAAAPRGGQYAERRRRSGGAGRVVAVIVVLGLLGTAVYLTRESWLAYVSPGSGAGAAVEGPRESGPIVAAPGRVDAGGASGMQASAPAATEAADPVAAGAIAVEESVVHGAEGAEPVAVAAETGVTEGAPDLSEGYVVHVASFVAEDRAAHLQDQFAALGQPCFIRQKDTANGEHWVRVYLGPYTSRTEADEALEGLKAAGRIDYALVVHLPFGKS